MALLFCDGTDAYTAASDLARKGWQGGAGSSGISALWGVSATAGAYGGGAIVLANNDGSPAIARWNTFTYSPGGTLNVGMLIKQVGLPNQNIGSTADNGGLIVLGYDGNGPGGFDTRAVLGVQMTGFLAAYATGNGAPLGIGTTNVCDGNWHWIEMQIVFSTTASGSMTVVVDGVQEIHVTNVTTVVSTPDGSVGISCGSNNGGFECANWFDDIIVWDNTGTAFNSFPIGQQRITTINPSAPGGSTQFTSSSGSNYAVASQPYSGTQTLTATTTGQTDLYATFGMGAFDPATINAVVCNVYASNPGGAGSFTVSPKVESNGTTVSGPSLPLTTVGQTVQGVFYTDSTNAAWTATSVNNAQIGTGD